VTVRLGGIPYSDLGALLIGGSPGPVRIAGWSMDQALDAACTVDAGTAVPANAINIGGWCFTPEGQLYTTEDAITGPFTWIRGFKTRQDGALVVLPRTPVPGVDPYIGGWAADGATSAALIEGAAGLAFSAPLNDAGAGAVNIDLVFGTGSGTFVRATTATTVGPTGLVTSVGTNVPRSYYDPTTMEYQGYLAEGQRTNLCLQSEDLATTWTNNRSSELVNATIAPDGAATADKLVEDATAANTHLIQQAFTFTGVVHSVSFFGKAAERTWCSVILFDGTTNFIGNFDLVNGVIGTLSNTTATIKQYPNGWWRCTITTNAAVAAAVGSVALYLADTDEGRIYDGNGISGAFFWGAQLEAAPFASSYIPTTTVAVTRDADLLTYPSAGNVAQGQGTAYAEAGPIPGNINNSRVISSTVGSETILSANGAPAALGFSIFDAVNNAGTSNIDLLVGQHRGATAWNTAILKAVADGGAVATTAAYDGSIFSGDLVIGGVINVELFGPVKNVRIWTTQLPDATLQAITA
jgi:hypothetical protein